jgi:SAM-dependent methyltransferase
MRATLAARAVPSVDVQCPVCGGASGHASDAPGWGEWRACRECTLEFVHPLRLPQDAMELYRQAYQGQVAAGAMLEYQRRLEMRHTILTELRDPRLWFWTPAFGEVLGWLERRVRRGGTVLELGCGLGFVLHAMRNAGFEAVGLDVAQAPVELNRRDGFRVWHGPVETLPHGWVQPDALVSFFVMHHLVDPIGFLRAAREHAPEAPIAIAVHAQSDYRRRRESDASAPPRTVTKWNARALARALQAAGYTPTVHAVASTGAERKPLKLLRRLSGRVVALPRLYSLGKRIEARMLAALPRRAKSDGYVVVAFAEPGAGVTGR